MAGDEIYTTDTSIYRFTVESNQERNDGAKDHNVDGDGSYVVDHDVYFQIRY